MSSITNKGGLSWLKDKEMCVRIVFLLGLLAGQFLPVTALSEMWDETPPSDIQSPSPTPSTDDHYQYIPPVHSDRA